MTRPQHGSIRDSRTILANIPDATPEQHQAVRQALIDSGNTDLLIYFFGEAS